MLDDTDGLRRSLRRGGDAIRQCPLDAVAVLLLLTCAPLMTSSHSEGRVVTRGLHHPIHLVRGIGELGTVFLSEHDWLAPGPPVLPADAVDAAVPGQDGHRLGVCDHARCTRIRVSLLPRCPSTRGGRWLRHADGLKPKSNRRQHGNSLERRVAQIGARQSIPLEDERGRCGKACPGLAQRFSRTSVTECRHL